MSDGGKESAAAGDAAPALALDGIVRTYRQGGEALEVLRGASLEVRAGEIVALVGPSGAGKSTLLQIAGLLERPNAGEVLIRGRACSRLGDDARTKLRRAYFGFVYQFHHLLPEFTALENVMLPQMVAGLTRRVAREHSGQLLQMVGLSPRAKHRPARLSGGEQQRVAIARAVANAPFVLLADEPTGNLDHQTADIVFAQILQLVHQTGLAALIATHNLDLADRMDRVLELRDGVIVEVG
jgi:lipoprotein-releasing system ATP-binding protein